MRRILLVFAVMAVVAAIVAVSATPNVQDPPSSAVSVLDHGATPNDASNDTAAFEAAAAAAGEGEHVYVPAGTWRIDNLRLPSDTHLVAEPAATIKKFGTSGAIFNLSGTDATPLTNIYIEGKNGGRFALDVFDAGQEATAIELRSIRDFSIKNMTCVQNNTNITQEAPSSRRPCINFRPLPTAQNADGTYDAPYRGLIENAHSVGSPYGWGLVQTTGGQDIHFENISGEGGVPLRLENYSNGWTPLKNITANNVVCKNGHNAVMFNPHGATHEGNIQITNVRSESCESVISMGNPDGTYGPNVNVDGVTAVPGDTAQVRDPDKTQTYVGAWLIAPSKWCLNDPRPAGGYVINVTNLDCGGLPHR